MSSFFKQRLTSWDDLLRLLLLRLLVVRDNANGVPIGFDSGDVVVDITSLGMLPRSVRPHVC